MLTLKSIHFGQQQFQAHRLEQAYPGQAEWLIGRNTSCDLVLDSPEVSRVHGRIFYSDGNYYFVDIDSTCGTLLNGETIAPNEKRSLAFGDLLQIGETFLYVEELTPPVDAPSSPVAQAQPFASKLWAGEDLTCRCCRIIDETPDVKTFCFVAEPPVQFTYQPGQFVNLQIEINGKPVTRPYSIASSPTRPAHLSLTVKRVPAPQTQPNVPAGLVSNWLHDHLRAGDRVKLVSGPLGHFTCLPNVPSKLLLISAGSGITPMMSMTRWAQDTLADCDIVFLHSARTLEDVVFRAELEAIAAQMSNFHLAVTITRPPQGQAWMGLTGRVSGAMLHMIAPDLMERSVFVCGPEKFMQKMKAILQEMNFPMQNYKEESFGGRRSPQPVSNGQLAARQRPAPGEDVNATHHSHLSRPVLPPLRAGEPNGTRKAASSHQMQEKLTMDPPTVRVTAPKVNFLKSKRSILVDRDSSLLELAEQAGVDITHSCRVGACGACKVRVHKGQPQYHQPPAALTPADQRSGYALACVAYAADTLEVEA
jgi:ferredoxin-NADP reductase/ferredoxin